MKRDAKNDEWDQFLRETWGDAIYREMKKRLGDALTPPADATEHAPKVSATAAPATPTKAETPAVPEKAPPPEMRADDLVGQRRAKDSLNQVLAMARVNEERKKRNLNALTVTLHAVFSGSPGTGKTTFARYYAQEIRKLGLLKKGHLVEVQRADLVAEFMGQTASKTKKVFDGALGGVLFIDEAYALKQSKDDAFGQECLDTLVKCMEDSRNDVILILAGYTDEMRQFLHLNTGLKSRIPNFVEFEDFGDDELLQIFLKFCEKSGMTVADADRPVALEEITRNRRGRSFGNAREARNVFERALAQQSQRLAKEDLSKLSTEALTTFVRSDLTASADDSEGNAPRTQASALDRLRALPGLTAAKEEIAKTADLLRVSRLRSANGSSIPLHWAFLGNTGTGKRTVARLVGDLYRELGVLSSSHWVEADRASLVAGYVGQTALKTKEKLEEALGGILFLRDPHTIVRDGAGESYGQEAIDTMAAFLEKYRGKIAVILAGPEEETKSFLAHQPALRTHFAHTLAFSDFNLDELLAVAKYQCSDAGFGLDSGAETALKKRLEIAQAGPSFGNARSVQQCLEAATRNQAVRLTKAYKDTSPPKEALVQLVADDFLKN